jgi:drug/metabolite transporter (DMT)-like permease
MTGLTAAVGPAFAAVLAWFFLRERPGRRTWIGVVVAMVGVAAVVLLSSGSGTAATIRNPAGAALVPLGQLSWAAFTVLSRSFSGREAPIKTITRVVTVGTVALLPAVPGALVAARGITSVEWLWFLHLALLGTVVPYLIWTTALTYIPAGETAAFMFLVPIMAGTWSAIILGERPTTTGVAAGVIVLAGVALTQTDRTTIDGPRIRSRFSRSEPRGEGPPPPR